MEIGIFLVGFFLGGFCGLFTACMAAAGKLADERTKQSEERSDDE